MRKIKLLQLNWYRFLTIAFLVLLFAVSRVEAVYIPKDNGDISTFTTTFLEKAKTIGLNSFKDTTSFVKTTLNTANDAIISSLDTYKDILSQAQLKTSSLASVGDSLTSISDGLAYGWKTFTYGILDNITDSVIGTKEFAVSVFDGAKFIGNEIGSSLSSVLDEVTFVGNEIGTSLSSVLDGAKFVGNEIGSSLSSGLDSLSTSLSNSISNSLSLFESKPKVVTETKVITPTVIPPKQEEVIQPTTTIINQIAGTGPQGERGPVGPQGLVGPQGSRGPQGEKGDTPDTSSFVLNSFLENQINRMFDSISDDIDNSSNRITEEGTLNDTTLNRPIINNATITASTFEGSTGTLSGNVEALTFNNLTITNNGTNTLNIATGKTLGINNSITLSGTDATTMIFPTTSATIARTDSAQTFTGIQTFIDQIVGSISGNAETVTNGVYISRTVNGHALSSDVTVTASDVSLGNVTNESKSVMFTNPTFTGTVEGFTVGGNIIASIGGLNLGTIGTRLGTIYTDNIDATNIRGTIVTGSTSSNDWTVNSANTTDDTQGSSLAFERGTQTPNALFSWDATNKTFTLNAPLEMVSSIGTASITGATSFNGLVITPNTGDITTGTWNGTTIADGKIASLLTGKTYNGLTITNNGTNTLNIQAGKTLATNGSITLTGTDAQTYTFPTTSATLARTDAGQAFTGTQTFSSLDVYGANTSIYNTYTDGVLNIGANTGANAYTQIYGMNTIRFHTFLGTYQERMRIDSNGYVGIGRFPPTYMLDVLGVGRFGGVIVNGYISANNSIGMTGGNMYIEGAPSGNIFIRPNGTGSNTGLFSLSPTGFTSAGTGNSSIAGNLGIGTTTPLSKLSINGGLHVGGDSDAGNDNILADGTITGTQLISNIATGTSPFSVTSTTLNTNLNADLLDGQEGSYYQPLLTNPVTGTGTTNYLPKFTGTSAFGNSLIYDDGTNVGIGTTIPTHKLEVLGTDNFPAQIKGSAGSGFILGSYDASWAGFWSSGVTPSTSNYSFITHPTIGLALNSPTGGYIQFDINDAIKMQLTTSGGLSLGSTYVATDPGAGNMIVQGNVGIGTTSPGGKLVLGKGAINTGVKTWSTTETATFDFYDDLNAPSSRYLDIASIGAQSGDGGGGVIRFITNPINSDTGIERIRITTAGNVGIGTPDPIQLLQVDKNQNAKTALLINNTNGGTGASAALFLGTDITSEQFDIRAYGTSFTTSGASKASGNIIRGSQVNGLSIVASDAVGDIRLYTGGATDANQRMTILSGGNVGIGTTTPAQVLEVNGNITVSKLISGTADYKFIGRGNINGDIISGQGYMVGMKISNDASNNGSLDFYTAAGNVAGVSAMTILGSGNVGIGTTTPLAKLHIDSSVSGANGQEMLRITRESAATGLRLLNYNGDSDTFDLQVSANLSSWINSVSFKPNGNVGIGTTNPATKLGINGDITLGLSPGPDQSYGSIQWRYGNTSFGTAAKIDAFQVAEGNSGYLTFSTNDGTAPTTTNAVERMRITSTGNVGIGTTAPRQNLEIVGSVALTTSAAIGGYYKQGVGAVNDYLGMGYFNVAASNDWYPTAGVPALVIKSTGNVGIGTTTPGSQLEIVGAAGTGAPTNSAGMISVLSTGGWGDGGGIIFGDSNQKAGFAGIKGFLQNGDGLGHTSGDLVFYTRLSNIDVNQTEVMRILSGGNVGIGYTDRSEKLAVNGSIYSASSITANSFSDGIVTWNAAQFNRVGGAIEFQFAGAVGSDVRMFGNTAYPVVMKGGTGNVGIGTTEPGNKLSVNGDIGIIAANKLILASDLTPHSPYIKAVWLDGNNTGLEFHSFADSVDTTAMVISKTTGNVGIGTTVPGSTLTIKGASSPSLTSGAQSLLEIIGTGTALSFTSLGVSPWTASIQNRNIPGAGDGSYPIALNPLGGNVGIGTTTPGYKLTVNGGYTKNGLIITNDAEMDPAIMYVGNYSSWQGSGTDLNAVLASYGMKDLILGTNFTEIMRITSNGKVGIGTTTPGNILTIQQTSATDPVADAWTVYSSGRWKEHRVPIVNALETIKELNPVYFDWKAEYGGAHDLGFIAEEVGLIVPEVVAWEDNGIDAKSIDYARLSTIAIAGVKELNLKLENINTFETDEEGNSIINSFRENITAWLANMGNNITDLYASVIHSDKVDTKMLCVGDTCVTEDQFLEIVNKNVTTDVENNNQPAEKTTDEKLLEVETAAGLLSPDSYTNYSIVTEALALFEETEENKLFKITAINDAVAGLVLKEEDNQQPPALTAEQLAAQEEARLAEIAEAERLAAEQAVTIETRRLATEQAAAEAARLAAEQAALESAGQQQTPPQQE